ncbi:hypothetical protein OG943_08975 [Amycolatopsis sp. NBC_00345]|uniref:hypothetical protein n=1 Tax=Amycolatopsis sp. NBC_00345 TaxID=2975955 RepID=UPI002E25B27E
MTEENDRAAQSILPVWREALGDKSGAMFGMVVTPRVRLEGAMFSRGTRSGRMCSTGPIP